MWLFALTQLGRHDDAYRTKAIQLVKTIHPRFVQPDGTLGPSRFRPWGSVNGCALLERTALWLRWARRSKWMVGVLWKMKDNLTGRYPGYGYGALDAFHGYVVYNQLAPDELHAEIAEMKRLMVREYRDLDINQGSCGIRDTQDA